MDLDVRLAIAEHDHVTTAGAAFAHIDLALAIVQHQSYELAERVARHLLIGDRPSQASFALPAQLASADPAIKAFERWVRDHLDQATFLLHTTQQSPESVALAVGYQNVSTLRALVRRRRGSTLTELTRRSRRR